MNCLVTVYCTLVHPRVINMLLQFSMPDRFRRTLVYNLTQLVDSQPELLQMGDERDMSKL